MKINRMPYAPSHHFFELCYSDGYSPMYLYIFPSFTALVLQVVFSICFCNISRWVCFLFGFPSQSGPNLHDSVDVASDQELSWSRIKCLPCWPPCRPRRPTYVTAPWRHSARASSAVWRPPSFPVGGWPKRRISSALWGSTAPSRWNRNGLEPSPARLNSQTQRKSGVARRACWEVRNLAAVLFLVPLEAGTFLIRYTLEQGIHLLSGTMYLLGMF